VGCFEHFGNPEYTFFNQVNDGVDKPPNASGGRKKRTSVRILAGFLRPIVLSRAKFGTVIIDRHRDCRRVIGLTSEMMIIAGILSARPALTGKANDWVRTRNKRLGSGFTAGTSLVFADAPRSRHLTPVCSAGITWRYFDGH
jgi:hypothetical protein